MKKLPAGRKTTLADKMFDNTDLAEKRAAGGSMSVVRANEDGVPELSDAIQALMIVAGVEARWVVNHWIVIGPNGKRSGCSGRNDFEEWQAVLNNMAPNPFKG